MMASKMLNSPVPLFNEGDLFLKLLVELVGENTLLLPFASKTSSNTSLNVSELPPEDVEQHSSMSCFSQLCLLFRKSAADRPGLTVREVLRLDERKPINDKISFFLVSVNWKTLGCLG